MIDLLFKIMQPKHLNEDSAMLFVQLFADNKLIEVWKSHPFETILVHSLLSVPTIEEPLLS